MKDRTIRIEEHKINQKHLKKTKMVKDLRKERLRSVEISRERRRQKILENTFSLTPMRVKIF